MNREQWLTNATVKLRDHFRSEGYSLPTNLAVTCGFPSRSALSRKRKRIGECWDSEASDSGLSEIFISPICADSLEVAAILAHECVHATIGLAAKHGARFRKCALSIGLEGKMTATTAGDKFKSWFAGVADDLGPYPHAKLNGQSSEGKKQTTRLIKVQCSECLNDDAPYIVRLSQSTLDLGAPICPIHNIALTA